MNKIRLAVALVLDRAIYFANEAAAKAADLFLGNDRITPIPAEGDHWVQLSPFGDFANSTGRTKVIQRFTHEDSDNIANAFNKGMGKTRGQPLGMPFYIGHPDHPSFRGQPGHTDVASKGRGVAMQTRYDANCGCCNTFANAAGDAEAEPCPDHGLFVKMEWNDEGKHIVNSKQFHGHSVNWGAVPDGKDGNTPVYRPIKVKSAGFTNEPNIPVKPASLANASDADFEGGKAIVPPRLKIIAGFKDDEDVTMDQVLTALEKSKVDMAANSAAAVSVADALDAFSLSLELANAKDDDEGKAFEAKLHEKLGTDPKGGKDAIMAALEKKLPDADAVAKVRAARKASEKTSKDHYEAQNKLEQQMSNAQQAVVDALVRADKIKIADAPAALKQLQSAGEAWITLANSIGTARGQVHSRTLARGNLLLIEGEAARRQKLNELLAKREQDFPNEQYDARYAAVMNSPDGLQLLAQMIRPGAAQD